MNKILVIGDLIARVKTFPRRVKPLKELHTCTTTPVNNPVRRAYELEWDQGLNVGRSSWDQTTVLYAINGTQYYNEIWEDSGRLRDDERKPKFTWNLQEGHRGFAEPRDNRQTEDEIERLMTMPPNPDVHTGN